MNEQDSAMRYEIIPGIFIQIDCFDLAAIRSVTWRMTKNVHGEPIFQTFVKRQGRMQSLSLARFLLKPVYGFYACRINPDRQFDYRRSNLIICDGSERQHYSRKSRRQLTSQYKGVSFNKKTGKWRASITVQGVNMYIGEYDNEEEAAQAYCRMAASRFSK